MEKYGTVPPRFTKGWWAYFWDYYKWHTIISIFVVVLIAVTAVQCATQTKFDLTVTYAGNAAFSGDVSNSIQTELGKIIDDSDENGECNVFFQSFTFGQENTDPQYEMAMQTKLMLEFSAGDGFLFIMSKDFMNQYLNQGGSNDLFIPVDEWLSDESLIDGVSLGKSGGKAYAVSLAQSAYFKNLGLDMQDYYLMIRLVRMDEEDDQRACIQFENSKKAANYLLAR